MPGPGGHHGGPGGMGGPGGHRGGFGGMGGPGGHRGGFGGMGGPGRHHPGPRHFNPPPPRPHYGGGFPRHRPYRGGGCCGCLLPVIGIAVAAAVMLVMTLL